MRNKFHIEILGHIHELTFSCYKNQSFLQSDCYCEWLAESIVRSSERYQFDILAFVFMPTHVHLLIKPNLPSYSMSLILKSIKQPVARRAIRTAREAVGARLDKFVTGIEGKPYRFWQDGGGHDRNIVDEHTLSRVIEYIHDNPVRKGLAESANKWKWSSCADWLGEEEGPIQVKIDF